MTDKTFSFNTDELAYTIVEYKGEKKYYVKGYISTPDLDAYDDIVTEAGMKSMLQQIQKGNITLDYEHEAWRDDNTILPVGRIVEAKIDDKGLWVKAEINPHSPKFENLWGSIKGKFINAFSIAFKPIKTMTKMVGDVQARLIDDLQLLNVALTGAPVNPEAKLTDYTFKSAMINAIKEMEETQMKQEIEIKNDAQPEPEAVEEQPVEEVKEEATNENENESTEEVVEEATEEAEAESEGTEEAVEQKSKEMEELLAELKSIKAEMKDMKEKLVFKSVKNDEATEEKSEEVVEEMEMDILSSL